MIGLRLRAIKICYFLIHPFFQMSDEGKDKKTPKRTFRINYERCGISGGRKKEQDTGIQDDTVCPTKPPKKILQKLPKS